jgi:ornithine cyclodeaminase/alanine dehydrogenase-like protein (mu-crystallin family)
MIILDDNYVMENVTIKDAIKVIKNAFIERFNNNLISPPRYNILDKIVITAGENTKSNISGFRCYNLYGNDNDQFITVINTLTGKIKGIITGNYTGKLRTGAIGALSIELLSKMDSSVLAVIGSGEQAFIQTLCAINVRNIKEIKVFSPSKDHRDLFIAKLKKETGIKIIECNNPDDATINSDIIITATTSKVPVINYSSINKGAHIVWVGSKHKNANEIGNDIISKCNKIFTDSIEQLNSYNEPHILQNFKEVFDLSDVLSGKIKGRENNNELTIFASTGLSGTEVMLADYILSKYDENL